MAGECLSYGAFGAYSTTYNRSNDTITSASFRDKPRRRVDSWTNYLPPANRAFVDKFQVGSQRRTAPKQQQQASAPVEEEYDHEYHAGIRDFNPEVSWVIKRYTPLDVRTYAPVPRKKYMVKRSGVPPPAHWIPPRPDGDPEVAKFSKLRAESQSYHSAPYSRDEKWSTLREMMPSTGRATRTHPPDWGTNASLAPNMTADTQRRFPLIQSPMSRFVSDMQLTNREFKLF